MVVRTSLGRININCNCVIYALCLLSLPLFRLHPRLSSCNNHQNLFQHHHPLNDTSFLQHFNPSYCPYPVWEIFSIPNPPTQPENLCLSDDFVHQMEWTEMHRMKGRERLLDKRCGTLPYVAPEVLVQPYAATPADIWSCGIILVTLLAGGEIIFLIYHYSTNSFGYW